MHLVYVAWSVLALVFIAVFFSIRANEDRATRKMESAIDPMFRPGKKGRWAARAGKPAR